MNYAPLMCGEKSLACLWCKCMEWNRKTCSWYDMTLKNNCKMLRDRPPFVPPHSCPGTLPSPLQALFNILCSALTPFFYCCTFWSPHRITKPAFCHSKLLFFFFFVSHSSYCLDPHIQRDQMTLDFLIGLYHCYTDNHGILRERNVLPIANDNM